MSDMQDMYVSLVQLSATVDNLIKTVASLGGRIEAIELIVENHSDGLDKLNRERTAGSKTTTTRRSPYEPIGATGLKKT